MKTQSAAHPAADVLLALGAGKLDNATAEAVFCHVEKCPECLKATGRIAGDSFLDKLRAAHGNSGAAAAAKDLSTFPPVGNTASIPTTSQIPALSIPQELHDHPQYEVLRELGRGGMGVVYLAKNKLMDRKEVLKVVNKQLLGDAGATERFLREIRAAAQLNHPNIVTAYSALQAGELLLFSMEYIDGRDLAEVIKSRGPLPAAHSGSYVLQAARGLQHAFEKGMVHRDIKPQNLILDGKKNLVKILDFGLAKATRATETPAEGLTGLNMMMGTPDYMAPEQARDATNVDIRADIYSLGCTLYFLLAGRAPFVGGSLAAKIAAHQLSEPDPIESLRIDLPAGLAEIARKMMAKDPAVRYQKPEEVVQALTACFKGQGKQPTAKGASAKAVTVKPIAASQLSLKREDKSIFEKKTLASVPAPRQTMRERPSPVLPMKNEKTVRPRKKWPMAAACAAAMLILVLIGLWAAGVFRVKTADGVLVVDVNEPNAEVFVDGERVTVSWDNGGKTAEVHVKPGTRKVEVRKDGYSLDGKELTFKDGDREVFAARLTPDEPRMVKVDAAQQENPPQVATTPEKAPSPSETPPPAKSLPLNSPTLGTVAPRLARSDYDDLAKGRWVAVLPSVKEFERLRSEKAYTGTEPRFVGGVLQCNGGGLLFPPVQAKDAIVRAWVTKPGLKFNGNVTLTLRRNGHNDVGAFFGGGGYFGIGRLTNHKWKDLQTCQFSEQYDGFFEFAFAAVGDRLIAYANGRKILEVRDEAPLDRPADIGVGSSRLTDGFGLFQDIEVQVLGEPSAEKLDKPSAEKPAESSQRPAPGGLPPEAKEAAKAFEKSRDDARDALLAEFDTVVDRLEKMSGSTQQRLKMIDAVKEEKNRFENSGLIPWSEPMRPYLAKYLAAIKTAEEKLVHVYTSLIDAQLKAKNESMAADLQTDLANLLNVRVVARWKEFMDGKPWGIRSLFSNGKIDNVKWKTTWSYSEGELIQKWVDAKAPGGVWVAKLKVSADGKTYAGTNNEPHHPKFTAVYLKDD